MSNTFSVLSHDHYLAMESHIPHHHDEKAPSGGSELLYCTNVPLDETTQLLQDSCVESSHVFPLELIGRRATRQGAILWTRLRTSKRVLAYTSTGVLTGVLLLVLLGLTLSAYMQPQRHASTPAVHAADGPQDIADQISRSVPRGVVVKIPQTSGQPITTQGPPATAATVASLLPSLDPRVNYSSLLKPSFHITAPVGWMNDPNGMFQASNGWTHVFYQWNPHDSKWGSPWWGHVVSQDMVKWKTLPPALRPDHWYDHDGVFSGSATVLPDGTPFMMFTGVMNFSQYGFYFQQQASAVPANLSDPYLVNWTKSAQPLSMQIPPGGTHAQFRDPTTAWQVDDAHVQGLTAAMAIRAAKETTVTTAATSSAAGNATARVIPGAPVLITAANTSNTTTAVSAKQAIHQRIPPHTVVVGTGTGTNHSSDSGSSHDDNDDVSVSGWWMTAVGTLDDCLGTASLYISNDSLKTWTYAGTLYSQLSQNHTQYSVCLPPEDQRDAPPAPAGSRAYSTGYCDQFGAFCRMWECPDFVQLTPELQIFKYSDQARGRNPWAADYYLLSDARSTNYTHALVQDGQDAMSGVWQEAVYIPRPVDYGVVYASKFFRRHQDPQQRLLWVGWIYEDSIGCTEVCGDGTPFIKQHLGWQGALTLIRQVSLDPLTSTLRFQPMKEYERLRSQEAFVRADITFPAVTNNDSESTGFNGINASDGNLASISKNMGSVVLLPVRESAAVVPQASGNFTATPSNATAEASMLLTNVTATSPADSDQRVSQDIIRQPGNASMAVKSTTDGRQVEVLVTCSLNYDAITVLGGDDDQGEMNKGQLFKLILRINTGNGTHTDVVFNATTSLPDDASSSNVNNANNMSDHNTAQVLGGGQAPVTGPFAVLNTAGIVVDRTASGGFTNSTSFGGPVPIPSSGLQADQLQLLRVFVDRSVVEVYALEGAGVVTSRLYPTPSLGLGAHDEYGSDSSSEGGDLGAWGYELLSSWAPGDVQCHVEMYDMDDCWDDTEEQ